MEGQSFADPSAAERMARYLARHGSLPRRAEDRSLSVGAVSFHQPQGDARAPQAANPAALRA
jgi:hypothetical protein